MVTNALRQILLNSDDITEERQTPPFKWTSISISNIIEENLRLEASVYGIEGRKIRDDLKKCKWSISLLGNEFIEKAFYLERFKRIYVNKTQGIPFILPSQITELFPKANKYISAETNIDIDSTRAKKGQILLTRSGTIGVVSYVFESLQGYSLSDDIIRIHIKEFSGYVYAYLKSKIGRLLIETNNYGAVISHIEPEHLENIPIPNPSPIIKQQIHGLIEDSFRLRDESNELINDSHVLLQQALGFKDLRAIQQHYYSVPLSQLNLRLDGSYHIPAVKEIVAVLQRNAHSVLTLADKSISNGIILPGRFKRVYVEEGNGVVFFGGKQIYELDPSNKKYLSLKHHGERIKKELTLQENMTLITCSGTIGKVAIVPKHWEGWTANQHIIRVIPAAPEIAGYIYAWLSSDYAYHLITRYTYGAVIDEIDAKQMSEIPIPLLQDNAIQQKINENILEANQKRAEAYRLEQKALRILDEKVIYAHK